MPAHVAPGPGPGGSSTQTAGASIADQAWETAIERAADALHELTDCLRGMLASRQSASEDATHPPVPAPTLALPLLLLQELADAVQALAGAYEAGRGELVRRRTRADDVAAALARFRRVVLPETAAIDEVRAALAAQLGIAQPPAAGPRRRGRRRRMDLPRYLTLVACTLQTFGKLAAAEPQLFAERGPADHAAASRTEAERPASPSIERALRRATRLVLALAE